MSVNGLRWEPVEIPLAAGLDTNSDVRAMQPPGLLVAKDIVFDETGGIQTRKPFASIGADIYPSGTLSDCRRIYRYGDELICFTKDTLYSWNASISKWVSRGTHLAVKTTEQPVFVTPGDQIDCDRAELDGTIVYCWTDTTSGSGVHIAALDKETSSVLLSPTLVEAGSSRPRLVALDDVIQLYFKDAAGDLDCIDIDPAAPASATGTQILAAANFNDYYDVVTDSAGVYAYLACRRDTTTSYSVFQITTGPSVENSATPARDCDQAIAIALAPNGTHLTVVRTNSTAIEADYLTVGLVDVTVDQAIGSGNTFHIAAAYRSTTDAGEYRCYIFWPDDTESAVDSDWDIDYNYVDTGGNIGTAAAFLSGHGLASRAFEHDGHVYVHVSFGGTSVAGVDGLRGQLQNTYFLYRDDGLLVGKECANIAGGLLFVAIQLGRLSGVQSLGSGQFAWCGSERRVIPLGGAGLGYSDRGPRDITITFDSNEARRVAALGETLYITGAELLQYDGTQIVECGFNNFPWRFTLTPAGSGGSIGAGTYTYRSTWRWENAKGERDRSTTASSIQATCVANDEVSIQGNPLRTSRKTNVTIEYWRTAADPDIDAPFYLVTGQDPATTTGDNPYLTMPAYNNDGTHGAIVDALADASLTIREPSNENGGVLENLAPPPCSIISSTEDRLFLAGVPGEPDNVWYSKLRTAGYVAAFHDALKVSVPKAGGAITAIAFLNDTLIVFRESAIYAVPGEGFDNTGGGSNYGPARSLSQDVGAVSAEAVALTPGGLIFKSNKGWHVLNRGFALDYIGEKVADFDSDTVYAVHVVENNHHVRIVTASRVLMFDYSVGEWAEWTITDGLHATVWNGTYHYLATAAVNAEQTSYTGTADGMDVETAWIRPGGWNGAVSVKGVYVIGEYRSTHHLRIRVYYDYLDTAVDDKYWTPSPTTLGGPEQVLHGFARPKCRAFKIRLTAVNASNHANPPDGEALKLTGLVAKVGFRDTFNRRLPAAQRQ